MSGPDTISESTMNRLLRRLDEQGLTRSQAGRGRVLSSEGQERAEQARSERRWHENLSQLKMKTLDDVRDLIVARRAVEREVVRSLATDADRDELELLRKRVIAHDLAVRTSQDRRKATIEFHRLLTQACPNRMLRGAASVLLDPAFDVLDSVLDIVAAGHGTLAASPLEHDAILDAVLRRKPDAAEAAMLEHFDRLSDDLTTQAAPHTARAIELFLQSQAGTSRALVPTNAPGDH